jgi:hypothetical protein
VAAESSAVAWSDVRREIEAVICIQTLEVPDLGEVSVPSVGDREACELPPPESAVARAVMAAYAEAQPVLFALGDEHKAAFGALQRAGREPQVEAVRRAYMSPAFLAVLGNYLGDALQAEGLTCTDCPEPVAPPRREIAWSEFEPYFRAHVWPDPVVTPVDADGKPAGKPRISAHICGGINGVAELEAADPALVRAGYLVAFHNPLVRESVGAFMSTVREDAGFAALETDEARTAYLRREIGPRALATPEVKASVCELLQRFEVHTGVVVTDCE